MKSKFLRMLSIILILSFLVSMLAVFAFAEDEVTDETEEEEENPFVLLYNRTYDDGWGVANGMNYNSNGGMANLFEIERETTIDYDYNYFWRLEVGANANSFMQLEYNAHSNIGAVLEFDIKTDDVTNMSNVVNFGTSGTSSAERSDYNLLTVKENKIYLMSSGDYTGYIVEGESAFTDPIATLGNEWMTFKVIFDYEYQHQPILETDTEEEAAEKDAENRKWFQLYIYYGPADGSEELTLWTGAPIVLRGDNGRGIQLFRFQVSGPKEEDFGTSICFDNIKAYTGTNKLVEITPDMGYGSAVDEYADKTEVIVGGNVAEASSAFDDGLSMKVGVDYCLLNSERTAIATDDNGVAYGAPVTVDGEIMIHLGTLLEHLGYPAYVHPDGMYIDISTGTSATYIVVGKDTATVGSNTIQLSKAPAYITDENGNSYLAIALSDVDVLFPGNYACYDDMGYIIITTVPDILDRNVNLQKMVDTMKKFVFDYATGEEIYEDVKEYTNGFQHPYLLGSAEQVNLVHEEYLALNAERDKFVEMDNNYTGNPADYPEEFWMWVHYERLVESTAMGAYKVYALKDENGTYDTFGGLNTDDSTRSSGYSLAQPYMDTAGYDVGGRSNIDSRTSLLERMAYGYAITGDIKYLQCAYEVAIELGKWTHWGPGHFLNCADSSADFAIYYDLTYNGYKKLAAEGIKRPNGEDYDTDVLATILYEKGVYQGYISTTIGPNQAALEAAGGIISPVVGANGFYYSERDNNWHAVCVSGMAAASLAVMGECDGAFAEKASYLISDNIRSLVTFGMQQYVPDGSYIEGPGYWNYGTNTFFRLCIVLENAAGTDYGLMDTWGIDKTCYFACHSESSDSRTFNFHDGAMSSQDTSYFFYVAQTFNDATLYDVRLNQINGNQKWAGYLDMLYYPRGVEINADEVALDYMPDSIDLFATRSGWEAGSLYAAICGGTNKLGHGQIDAGSFVYHNGGNVWIIDLGTEDYNCAGFWPAATRYRFYVMKPEGNNTIALSTDPGNVPYGQLLESTAPAIASGSNEYGSYVIYNMQGTLGDRAIMWNRGMLLTNDRKTTIIQDELVLDSAQNVWWFAHYYLQKAENGRYSSYGVEDVQISSDGRTAYLIQYLGVDEKGNDIRQAVRLSIVSNNPSQKFQIMDTYTFVHNDPETGTYKQGFIATQGSGVPEKDRSRYRKLAISSGKVMDFRIAVVMELIEYDSIDTAREIDVGYEFTDMKSWEPTTDMRGKDIVDTIVRRGTPNINNHLVKGVNMCTVYLDADIAYTDMIHSYYRSITDAYYLVRMLGVDLPSQYKSYSSTLSTYKKEFDLYRNELLRLSGNQTEFVYKLMGLK